MTRKTMQDEIRELKARNDKLIERLVVQTEDAILAREALVAIDRLTSQCFDRTVQAIQPKITEWIKKGLSE